MASELRQNIKSGVTIIKLVVTVVIIGVLAAILFPIVEGTVGRAKAARLGQKGREIYISIFDENVLKTALNEASIYPGSATGSSNYYPTSTAFLKDTIDKGYIKNVDFSFFSAPEMAVHASTNSSGFEASHNAWCITADIDEKTLSSVPFLFTRNIHVEANNLAGAPSLNPGEKPFGNKLAVVVTKGGIVRIIPGEKFNQNTFNPTEAAYPVLRP